MRFLEQFKGDDPSGTRGRFAETFNKYDPFQRSEGRNWAMSELGSIINSVVKRPEYKDLKAKKGSIEAINELLGKQGVFDAAVREAAVTAAETQVASNPAMRAEFYDSPLHRIIGMFTAFKTRQIQVLERCTYHVPAQRHKKLAKQHKRPDRPPKWQPTVNWQPA